MRHNELSIVM